MKTLILILFALPVMAQKPVISVFGGLSNYYDFNCGVEAGFAIDRLTILGTGQINYDGGITYGAKAYLSAWLDWQKESFFAPVVGMIQQPYIVDNKEYRPMIPVLGVRYQVYGGYGELITNFGYYGFGVGYMFGNRKNK